MKVEGEWRWRSGRGGGVQMEECRQRRWRWSSESGRVEAAKGMRSWHGGGDRVEMVG